MIPNLGILPTGFIKNGWKSRKLLEVGKMNNKNEWPCLTLSKEDIDHVAQKLGVNTNKFSSIDYDEIARKFIKGFGWSNEAWEDILEEAVNLHVIEKQESEP